MTFADLKIGQGFYEAHSHHEYVKVSGTEARPVSRPVPPRYRMLCLTGHWWDSEILKGSTVPQTPRCPHCDRLYCHVEVVDTVPFAADLEVEGKAMRWPPCVACHRVHDLSNDCEGE